MVSPEMNPTICWMFEAEIVLLFHAKTFHKGFQVTVHTGNVRQTATVVAVRDKVGSFTQTWDGCILSQCVGFLLYSQCLFCFCFSLSISPFDTLCHTGGAEDWGESGGSLQVHQAPRIPEGGGSGTL